MAETISSIEYKEQKELFGLLENSLKRSKEIWIEIQSRTDATMVLKDGTFGDLGGDQEVKADVMMGRNLTEYLSGLPNVAEVITEEGTYSEAKSGDYTAFIDPLDSSANAIRTLERLRLELPSSQHDLPFGTVISLARNKGTTINDVVGAGFIRQDTGYSYIAVKGLGFYIVEPDGGQVKVELSKIDSQPRTLSDLLKNGWTLWAENYYPETRTVVNDKLLNPNEKGYIRSNFRKPKSS